MEYLDCLIIDFVIMGVHPEGTKVPSLMHPPRAIRAQVVYLLSPPLPPSPKSIRFHFTRECVRLDGNGLKVKSDPISAKTKCRLLVHQTQMVLQKRMRSAFIHRKHRTFEETMDV